MSLKVTVSGSFHRHMSEIREAVQEFQEHGVAVLSPADPRVVDEIGAFLFVASDRHRSIRLVQDRHLASIIESDFLWLICPDGHVGQSASLEVGFAIARAVPVFSRHLPPDMTLRQYVDRVDSIAEALRRARNRSDQPAAHAPSILVDPATAVTTAHAHVEAMGRLLLSKAVGGDPAMSVGRHRRALTAILSCAG